MEVFEPDYKEYAIHELKEIKEYVDNALRLAIDGDAVPCLFQAGMARFLLDKYVCFLKHKTIDRRELIKHLIDKDEKDAMYD